MTGFFIGLLLGLVIGTLFTLSQCDFDKVNNHLYMRRPSFWWGRKGRL